MEHKKQYSGLSDEQVTESRRIHGENILTPPLQASLWSQLIEKFTDPIVRILLIALLASVGVACYRFYAEAQEGSIFLEPLGILFAIILATCVSFAFEVSANKKFKVLNRANDDTPVKVIRSGNVCEVAKREVVVGDIVMLEAGEEIPADGQLLEAISLQVNESTLTGEPVAHKTTNPENFKKDATYSSDMALKGTTVVDGHGIMEVQKVGDATEYGKVFEGSQIDNKVETPLNKQLSRLGDFITYASYAIAAVIIAVRLLLYFTGAENISWINAGSYILNTVMIAVTVMVVALPEGLPMSVTLSLALSMKRMFSTNNLVRKMHACETMGAATVICTDKTGTLTQNQMKVFEACFYSYDGAGLEVSKTGKIIAEGIALNSTAHLNFSDDAKVKALGNPTEGALLLWLHENGVSYLSLREAVDVVEQLTFSTERKYMATVAKSPAAGQNMLYVKGAPEIVLARCANVLVEGKLIPVAEYRPTIEQQLLGYQHQAMRTLGFACKEVSDGARCFAEGKLATTGLTCLGVVAISDPLREDAPAAVATCLQAGIDVKIVTGDTSATAKEIARQIGLWSSSDESSSDRHITGAEFAGLSDEALRSKVLSLKIMSRARPMDKERLVRLLQQKNQVVAVTGDGTNDAPALNAAQVGLSMGDGTSVAKEASDITILDNSFKSITRAVMWGRSLYQNIQRFIFFQMIINVAACLIVLIGSFLGTESPLTITQMLWVNLIMDTFAALALASLPPSEEVMLRKPRKATDHIISKKMAAGILGTGTAFLAILFGLLQYFKHDDVTGLTQLSAHKFFASYFDFSGGNGLSPYELSLFFTTFVLLQFWNMFNAKAFGSGRSAFFELHRCMSGFVAVALIILVGQFVIVTVGGRMFNVVPLHLTDWGIIVGTTSLVLWAGEAVRLCRRKFAHARIKNTTLINSTEENNL
ncbi:MAG: calcium-translocating P-type ATPase, PMCA-type [Prevotellaceae bacterium]|jgi:Ca2+-transporting ATPase|nr:calcium-translocating P-type ATPase, PMCA-type [Prevotellaceae bacterium]